MKNRQYLSSVSIFLVSLFSVLAIMIFCGALPSYAAMADEAENYTLGVEKTGSVTAGGKGHRYFRFTLNQKTHFSIDYSCNRSDYSTNFLCEWDIVSSSGDTILSNDDITTYIKLNKASGIYSGQYGQNLDPDTYYLHITTNSYTGSSQSVQFAFTIDSESIIKLPKGTISSAKSNKAGQISVNCGEEPDAIGYQIQYTTNERFKKSVKTVRSASPNKTISKLKKGVYYYVRVRPYTIYTDGVYVYGQYSTPKSVKVKK